MTTEAGRSEGMLLQMSFILLVEKRETSPPIFVFCMTYLCLM